ARKRRRLVQLLSQCFCATNCNKLSDLLFANGTDARHCHWLVCQPLCFWTGGVNMAISTFATLPTLGALSSGKPAGPWINCCHSARGGRPERRKAWLL